MNSIDFCYWLQGYFEIAGENAPLPTKDQVNTIKNHLNLVFVHEIDPKRNEESNATPKTLKNVHDGLNDTLLRC